MCRTITYGAQEKAMSLGETSPPDAGCIAFPLPNTGGLGISPQTLAGHSPGLCPRAVAICFRLRGSENWYTTDYRLSVQSDMLSHVDRVSRSAHAELRQACQAAFGHLAQPPIFRIAPI